MLTVLTGQKEADVAGGGEVERGIAVQRQLPLSLHLRMTVTTTVSNKCNSGKQMPLSLTVRVSLTATLLADYDQEYDDDYDYQATTSTTTTTQRPRGRGRGGRGRGRGRSRGRGRAGNRRQEPTEPPTTTTTTTLSPNYKPRPDGRIIDYNADPNFPYELKGADLTLYPFYISIPENNFNCSKRHDGYYANIELSCQVYHHCASGHQRYDFLCPNYTLFDQTTFTCRFINTVDCGNSEKHYVRNNELYVESTTPEPKINDYSYWRPRDDGERERDRERDKERDKERDRERDRDRDKDRDRERDKERSSSSESKDHKQSPESKPAKEDKIEKITAKAPS